MNRKQRKDHTKLIIMNISQAKLFKNKKITSKINIIKKKRNVEIGSYLSIHGADYTFTLSLFEERLQRFWSLVV